MSKEMVQHPDHYNTPGRKECIVEMEEKYGIDFCVIFALGNAYKYAYRCGYKDAEDQEKRKIAWYENYAQEHIKECVLPNTIICYHQYFDKID